jgi:signal transduction histidine kinase
MQRIVTNLLENATKYTPPGGTVTISAKAQNGGFRLNIDDTGIGISQSDLPRIFERFYRCDHSRSLEGVGLGLSLVKAFTASMGGTIQVESRLDQGSRFTLSFAV